MARRSSLALGASCFLFPVVARAQCATEWLPGAGVPGVLGEVHAVALRDPDGGGPLPARVLVGGELLLTGAATGSDLVEWDPATGDWAAVGAPLRGIVRDVLPVPNGDVYAAGELRLPSEAGTFPIARWDGVAWSRVGDLEGDAYVLTLLPDGRIAIGGAVHRFDAGSGVHEAHLAVWDGASVSFAFGVPDGPVRDMIVRNGELIVRGEFLTIGGVGVQEFARWDGASWSALPFGSFPFGRRSMALLANGDLVCLLPETTVGGGAEVGVWNGTTWSLLQAPGVRATGVFVRADGTLLCHTAEGPATRTLRLTTAGWIDVSLGAWSLPWAELAGGELVVGLRATAAAIGIARWNGSALLPMGTGTLGVPSAVDWLGSVEVLLPLPNGDLVVGGAFTMLEGVRADNVARWDGTAWHPLGAGLDGRVRSLASLPNGDLVAAGEFTAAGGAPASQLARWDGVAWTPFANPIHGEVRALAVTPDGDLYVGGGIHLLAPATTGIVRWNGTTWSAVGRGIHGSVRTMEVAPDGDLLVGGDFVTVDGWPDGLLARGVARWDGALWSALGGTTAGDNGVAGTVDDVHVLANGDVVVAGAFVTAGGVPANGLARWDGTQWQAFAGWEGAGLAVTSLPDGDLLASHAGAVRRWDGLGWSDVGHVGAIGPAPVRDLRFHLDRVWVGGSLFGVGSESSLLLARLASTCPAAVVASAPGCAGASLTATTLPWVDGTLRTQANGLAAGSLALAVTGFQAALPPVPLASLLPQGAAGCALHVVPEVLQLVVTDAGAATIDLFVPSVPTLTGLTFRQQVLGFELDAAGAIVGVVATDALALHVGQF